MRIFVTAALCCAICVSPALASSSAYADIPADHWALNALDYLYEKGVLEGPYWGDGAATRCEVEASIARLVDTLARDGYLADSTAALAAFKAGLQEADWNEEGNAVPVWDVPPPAGPAKLQPRAVDDVVRHGSAGYDDVPAAHWAAQALMYLADVGYFEGYP